MDNYFVGIIIRSLLAYGLVFFAARILGRKLISQMTFFDFIVGISLGTLTASVALGAATTSAGAAAVIIVFTITTVLLGVINIKTLPGHKFVESEPVTIIENGKINDENMRKVRYDLSSLFMHLRQKNVFNIADVEFAIFEPDGKLSVQKKSQKQPLTPSDINVPSNYKGLMTELILDGLVLEENLNKINLDKQWLESQLKSKGIQSIDNVFFAGLDTSGNLYVSQKFDNQSEKHGEHGIE